MSGIPINGEKRKDPNLLSDSFLCEVHNDPIGWRIIKALKLVAKNRGQRLDLRGRHPNRNSILPESQRYYHEVPLRLAKTIRIYFRY